MIQIYWISGLSRSSWSCYFFPETSQECRARAFELMRSEVAWAKGTVTGKQNYTSKEIWAGRIPKRWGNPWSYLQPTTEINGSLITYHRKMDRRWWRAQVETEWNFVIPFKSFLRSRKLNDEYAHWRYQTIGHFLCPAGLTIFDEIPNRVHMQSNEWSPTRSIRKGSGKACPVKSRERMAPGSAYRLCFCFA